MFEFIEPETTVLPEEDGKSATVVISPLDAGFGVTVGNALRRVMLSSLPGAAAVYLRIGGVMHEFCTVPGVAEDVTEIVLNVKGIVASLHGAGVRHGVADVVGPCTVTAGDLRCDADLEIVNPEQVVATVSAGERFMIDVAFDRGRGYVPAQTNQSRYAPLPLGAIAVDSIFTPVLKVHYAVEDTRVGDNTAFDRLTMEIRTNGSVSPEEAVATASNVIVRHFECVSGVSDRGEMPEMKPEEGKTVPPVLDTEIEALALSVRSSNCLRRAGLHNVGDLVGLSSEQVMKIRNLGRKSYDEICEKLQELGLSLRDDASVSALSLRDSLPD